MFYLSPMCNKKEPFERPNCSIRTLAQNVLIWGTAWIFFVAVFLFFAAERSYSGPLSELIIFSCKPYRYFQLYCVRPDGRDLRQIINIKRDCRDPNLCAKNNELLFSMFTQNTWNIYQTDLNGSYVKRITSTNYVDRHPVWSPDGQYIAFDTTRWGGCELAVMKADGSGVRRLTHNALLNAFPVWSPDGRKLAFVSWKRGHGHIYVMDMQTERISIMTKNYLTCVTPSWAPDSEHLVFLGRSYFGHFLAYMNGNQKPHELREFTEHASYPAWSPNGQQILFSDSGKGFSRLTLLDPQTGQTTPLLADLPAPAYDLVWQKKTKTWQ